MLNRLAAICKFIDAIAEFVPRLFKAVSEWNQLCVVKTLFIDVIELLPDTVP